MMQHVDMQESHFDNIGSYMKPLSENLNKIYVESSIMYKRSYHFRNEHFLIDLHNDWTEIENKNDWKVYPTRIPKKMQYFKDSFEEPGHDNYDFKQNDSAYIDKYLFEDIPKTFENPTVAISTKKVNIELENISEDDSTYDCCSLWSIDESFCSCENTTNINKNDNTNSNTRALDDEPKDECIEQNIRLDQDLKETSCSTENSSCPSDIASPVFEVISPSNHKKDSFYKSENSCQKIESATSVSNISPI